MAEVRDYTALLSGSSIAGKIATGVFVSFSFPTAAPAYLSGLYSPEALASFQPFSDAEKAAARDALNAWAAVSGLTFLEVAPEDGDIKFSNYDMDLMNPDAAGFAYYPDDGYGGNLASDIQIGIGYALDSRILLHEIGHALGLKHPFEDATTLAPDLDNFGNTVMSYTSDGSAGTVLGSYDVGAIRYLYGDAGAKQQQIAGWFFDGPSLTLTQAGGELADVINGIGGNDAIYALGGDDTISVRGGRNRVEGGDGNDEITAPYTSSTTNMFDGGAGDDLLIVWSGDDLLIGGAGNDVISGGGGFDRVNAGDGDDGIALSETITRFEVDGGAGNDALGLYPTLAAGATFSIPDLLAGGSTLAGIEAITIEIDVRDVTVVGSALRDSIQLHEGVTTAFGEDGDDTISTKGFNNSLWGGNGADELSGGSGYDVLHGDAGNDRLTGGGGLDRLYGGDGDDTLSLNANETAHSAYVVLDGGDGYDVAVISSTVSTIISNAALNLSGVERVTVDAGDGWDRIDIRGLSDVTIDGGGGNDAISARDATGKVKGGAGDDVITAGKASAWLYGGSGADEFVFLNVAASNSRAWDDLVDFETGVDRVDIAGLYASNLRIVASGSGSGSWVYADSAQGSFQLFVHTSITLSDILTTGRTILGDGGDPGAGAAVRWGDSLVGTAGSDRLIGGKYGDTLTGGAGADTFEGTRADLAGDEITDFAMGERIHVTDATASLRVSQVGDRVTLSTGQVLTIGTGGDVRLGVRAAEDGGYDVYAARQVVEHDFDGDGRSDVLWRNTAGFTTTWASTGTGWNGKTRVGETVTADWKIAGNGDFNGDGTSDLLWRNDNGRITDWWGGKRGFNGATGVDYFVGADWRVADTGDLDGDGRDDIIWRNDNGRLTVWLATDQGFNGASGIDFQVATAWEVAGAGDFNGDGKDDLLWRDSNGAVTTWLAGGPYGANGYTASPVTLAVGAAWQVAGVADFNGDDWDDILWRNADGRLTSWLATEDGFVPNDRFTLAVPTAWAVEGTGDYSGDGRADILWRNIDGGLAMWTSTGDGFTPANGATALVGQEWGVFV